MVEIEIEMPFEAKYEDERFINAKVPFASHINTF